MQRIGTPDGLFVDGDPFNKILGTIVRAVWLNSMQEEVAGVIEGLGFTLDPTKNDQLLTAIETLIEARAGNYLVDTGSANAYAVTLNPPVTQFPNGLEVRFRARYANTAASTLNGAPLLRDDGAPLQPGDIEQNAIITATYDTPANAFLVNSIVLSQLGALAQLGIGNGLKSAGGNLTLKLASLFGFDSSGSLTINLGAGLQTDAGGNLAITGSNYVNASSNVCPGLPYLVDTSAGGFVLTLPASPKKGTLIEFIDAWATWSVNKWTIGHNGNTIMGQSSDLTVNLSDQRFSIWYSGSDWRLI